MKRSGDAHLRVVCDRGARCGLLADVEAAWTQWGLVAVLVGILVLRVVLFVINLRQQRHNAERGKGSVNIETRLGLNDEPETSETEPPASSPGAPRP